MEEFHVLVNLWMWPPNLESTAALCLSIFSSFKILSAWKFNNVEKNAFMLRTRLVRVAPLGPVLPVAIHPAATFCLLISSAVVHVRSSRGFGSCGAGLLQFLVGFFVKKCESWPCDWWILLSLSFILSVCICTFWIFAYMHAFKILRMPCVNLAWIFWECLVVRFVLWIFQMLLEFPCDCNVRTEFSNFLEF